jgi:protein disulfide-isomerase A6
MIAKVDCDAENSKGVARQEGVTSFPTIKWFKKGSMESELYEGGRKIENFVKFVNREANLHRAVGGSLDDLAGTVESLNAIVARYVEDGKGKLADLAAEAKKEVERLADAAEAKYGQYYVRVFEKLGQNAAYVEKELGRLQGMLGKGGLAPAKRDEITTKLNVLKKFTEKPEEAKKEEDVKDEL